MNNSVPKSLMTELVLEVWKIWRSLPSPNCNCVLSGRLTDDPAPMLTVPAIPTPPSTINAPVVTSIESFWSSDGCIFTLLNIFNFSLKLTGPSNCDNDVFDLPPSTNILSLTVTSSKITLNLDGSAPVIVGTGTSKLISSPVVADFLLLPI